MKLTTKLKNTKIALKKWNKKVFGWMDQNITKLEQRFMNMEDHLQRGYVLKIEDDYMITKCELDY